SRGRGPRNPQATRAIEKTTASSASRKSPLRQPFTVSHVVHRTSRLERALHQVDGLHERRLRERERRQRTLKTAKRRRPRIAGGASQSDMGAERPGLRREAERGERPLHTVLQELERRLRRDADPDHARPPEVRKCTEAAERERQRVRAGDGPAQGVSELGFSFIFHLTEKLERNVDA